MFRTLYSRLALTLFMLLCLVGVILIQVIGHSSTLYQQEVAQKLNRELAAHIVEEQSLIQNREINRPALDLLFHQLMVINPSIELYLLDESGAVLGYSAPEGKVKRTRIALEPVRKFLDDTARFPLKGDDPRNPDGQKVFSAAPIADQEGLQGYLYVVLGGEQYDHVVQMLGKSYILDSALVVLLVALAAALTGGLVVFALQTHRLRLLGNVMRRYAGEGEGGDGDLAIRYPEKTRDEIDVLGRQFNTMANKITSQIHELRQMDDVRREMVANISHDLRTPLTTMRGYLETLILKNSELSAEEQHQYLQTALSHSQRLGRMVEELFELARLDSCESVIFSEPFSMCELVQDVTQKFQLRAREKSIHLKASLNPDAPQVYGDIAMMQRVLENLLENGLRHTPVGGSIEIGVDVESSNVVVQVSDTGCGIPEEDVLRIFERFYQKDVNRSGDSAGLGLAIVKRILELHGSIINVTSELEKGTTFSFRMPSGPIVINS
ncbi:MAG: HAMP domain-containing histidine kinase [Gammaproteobacteria bacterium]|nr:HAMP domain-containing histidine kinase [Gammaproteobacteria bacterium]